MDSIIFKIENGAEDVINMLDESQFEEPPDGFEMIQALEEQLRLHKEGQQEKKMARQKLQTKLIKLKEQKTQGQELQEVQELQEQEKLHIVTLY